MNNKYQTYIPHIEQTVSIFEQQYLYNPRVKQPFYIRFLVWLAKKAKLQHEMSVRYETFNLDLISDLIFENIHASIAVFNREAGYIVIGRDKFDYLQVELDDLLMFPIDFEFHSKQSPRMSFYGLTIVLVPWFDGIVVLPKDINK